MNDWNKIKKKLNKKKRLVKICNLYIMKEKHQGENLLELFTSDHFPVNPASLPPLYLPPLISNTSLLILTSLKEQTLAVEA